MSDGSPDAVVVALLGAAAFVGGVVDAIGGGGGLISLPALLAAGLPAPLALGTNKGQAVFGAVTSAVSFWRWGKTRVAGGRALLDRAHGGRLGPLPRAPRLIDRERALPGFAAGFVGAYLGARGVLAVPLAPLRAIVIALLVGAALLLLLPKDVAPRARLSSAGGRRAALLAIAFVIGAYDGFFGPGTGSMLVVAFAMVFGDELLRASANAKVVNLASNLAAVVVFAGRGTVLWRVSLPMAACNALGAAVGAHLAVKNGDRLVRAIVLVVVAAVVVKLVAALG